MTNVVGGFSPHEIIRIMYVPDGTNYANVLSVCVLLFFLRVLLWEDAERPLCSVPPPVREAKIF